jgi:dipeptidyl aminopeptidase/acylaminoacyl peptidase
MTAPVRPDDALTYAVCGPWLTSLICHPQRPDLHVELRLADASLRLARRLYRVSTPDQPAHPVDPAGCGSLTVPCGPRALLSARRDGPAWTLVLADLDGGDRRELTSFGGTVEALACARDGSVAVARVRVFPAAADLAEDAALREQRTGSTSRAVLYRGPRTHLREQALGPDEPRLIAVDVASGHSRDLTPGAGRSLRDQQFAVSASGRWVASTVQRELPGPTLATDLVLIDTRSGERSTVAGQAGWDQHSPSFGGEFGGEFGGGEVLSWLSSRRSSRLEPTAFEIQYLRLPDRCRQRIPIPGGLWPDDLRCAADGRTAYFVADEQGSRPLFAVTLADATIRRLTAPGVAVLEYGECAGQLAAIRSDPLSPGRLVLLDRC